tara:strand:- start:1808 stop:2056 length:249 start_codon:yes stop_codon:yes gene_type:complete
MTMSIKKKKDSLDSKFKELTKEKKKAIMLMEELKRSSISQSEIVRIENSLLNVSVKIRSIESEMEDAKKDIYGSWEPSVKEI